jgi:hypothetical protein
VIQPGNTLASGSSEENAHRAVMVRCLGVRARMLRAWRHPDGVADRTGAPRAWPSTVLPHRAVALT